MCVCVYIVKKFVIFFKNNKFLCYLKELYFCYIKTTSKKLGLFINLHRKNDFAEKSKILLDRDLKIILDHQNNSVGKNNEQRCKKF